MGLLSRPFITLLACLTLSAHGMNLLLVLPRYVRALGSGERGIGVVMGTMSLASLITMPFVARAAERFGRAFPLVAGGLLFVAGSALLGLARSLPLLVAARAVQGVGWAGVWVGNSILVIEVAPRGRLGQAIGVAGVVALLAMALGPLLGEVLVDRAGWPWLFGVSAGLGAAGVAVAATLPAGGKPHAPAAAVPLFGALFFPGARLALTASVLVAIGFGAVIAFLADHTALRHLPSIAPFFNAYVAAAILARLTLASLSDRVGRHRVIIPALAALAVALAGLAFLSRPWHLWALGALFGISHGLYYPALQALIVERAAPDARGHAAAAANFAFSFGITVSAYLNGLVAELGGYSAVYLLAGALAAGSIPLLMRDGR